MLIQILTRIIRSRTRCRQFRKVPCKALLLRNKQKVPRSWCLSRLNRKVRLHLMRITQLSDIRSRQSDQRLLSFRSTLKGLYLWTKESLIFAYGWHSLTRWTSFSLKKAIWELQASHTRWMQRTWTMTLCTWPTMQSRSRALSTDAMKTAISFLSQTLNDRYKKVAARLTLKLILFKRCSTFAQWLCILFAKRSILIDASTALSYLASIISSISTTMCGLLR